MHVNVIKLNNYVEVPQLGFGVFQITDEEECRKSVLTALQTGYRLIDTAACYGNERAVGQAVKESGIDRKDIFLTSKVWIQDAGYEKTKCSFEKTLENLQTDYLDLYLIHWPKPSPDCENWKKLDIETWKALEKLYHEKRVRAIGVSNFLPHHIENLLESCEVVPAVDQLEFHPGYTQEAAVRYCQEHDILVQAWSPLGRRRVMDDELIRALAERRHVTQAQICLRYAFQKGIIPIPKASSEERMKNNQDIFGFELTKTEMQKLDTMPPVGWSGEHPDRERVSIE